MRQDVLDICARWGAGIDPARVNVIAVPPMRVDPDAVFRNFGAVVGYDPAVIALPGFDVNASFGYVEAEVLRRLNLALGKRLPDYRADYLPAIRRTLVQKVLARQASGRITLPPEHLGWVTDLSRERLDAVRAARLLDARRPRDAGSGAGRRRPAAGPRRGRGGHRGDQDARRLRRPAAPEATSRRTPQTDS